jgi:hypothetical protein
LPFQIDFTTRGPAESLEWEPVEWIKTPATQSRGDGCCWTIDLGPPFLRLSVDDPQDEAFRANAAHVWTTWIAKDRSNLMRFHQSIGTLEVFNRWRTNSVDQMGIQVIQYWSPSPGENLDRICATGEPLLVNLGIHLQAQNDSSAYSLIPVLEWINARQQLGEIGKGLLRNLIDTRDRGIGPDLKRSKS